MKLVGHEISDAILLLPAIIGIGILGVFGFRLLNEVRASVVFISMYSIFGLIGLFLYWRNPDVNLVIPENSFLDTTDTLRRSLSVLFFLSFAVSIVCLELHSPGAVRPFSYYLFVSIALGIVAGRTVLTTGTKKDVGWILVQILLLALLTRLALVYLNPYPYVSDTLFHWNIVVNTVSSGEFLGRGPYEAYPIFHLFNGSFFLLSLKGTSFAWLFPLLNNIVVGLTVVVFYLFGRLLYDPRVGLISAVFALTANYYFLAPMYKTNWIGVTFLLFSLLLILRLISGNDVRMLMPFWVLAVATLLIHPVVFISLILTITGVYFAVQERAKLRILNTHIPVFSLTSIFAIYIIYIHQKLFYDLVSATIGIDQSTSGQLGLTVNVAEAPLVSQYTFEFVINFVGPTLLALFIVPGILIGIRRRESVVNSLSLMLLIMYVFVLAVLLTNRGQSLSVTRTLLYLSPISVLVGAIGFSHYIPSRPTRKTLTLMMGFVIFLALFSSMSYLNNFNGMYSENINHFQLTAKPSTMTSHSFLERTPDGTVIIGDKFNIQYVASTDSNRGLQQLDSTNATSRFFFTPNWTEGDLFLVDRDVLSNYQSFGGPDYVGLDNRLRTNHSRVYANSEYGIYHRNA